MGRRNADITAAFEAERARRAAAARQAELDAAQRAAQRAADRAAARAALAAQQRQQQAEASIAQGRRNARG